jgi:Flagellar biogenesis protein
MDSFTYYVQFIGYSLLIIVFLLIVLKASKKYQKNHISKEIKIIDRFATGSQSNIFILEIKNNTYILGATNTQINIIDKL